MSSKLTALTTNPSPAQTDIIYDVPAAGGAQYKITIAALLGLSDLVISEASGVVTATTKTGKTLTIKTDTGDLTLDPVGFIKCNKTLLLWDVGIFGYFGYSLKLYASPADAKYAATSDGKFGWANDAGNASAPLDTWLYRPAAGVVAVGAAQKLQVGDAAVSETPTATHTLRLRDSTGTEYRVLAVPV